MHKHSHLHRRHDGAMDKLQDEVHDLVARQHHHHSSQDDSEGRADQDRLEARDDSDNGPGNTAVSIVYVTAAPTFTGAIAGFTTIGVPAQASAPPVAASPSTPVVVPPPQSSPAPPSDTPLPPPVSTAAATTAQPSTPTSSPSLLSSIVTHSTDASSSTTLVASTVTSSSPSAVSAAASAAASTQAPSVTTDKDSVNSGLSGGAKAGIAIGVILGVLALVAAVFALLRLKKRREEEAYGEALNEKNPFADHAAAPAPPQTSRSMVQPQAPVLPPMGIMGAAPTHGVEKRADSPTNPFGPGAETVREVNTAGSGAAPSSSHSILGAAAAGAVGGVAAATVAKRTSIPAPLKISRAQSPALAAPVPAQASPAVSQFSEASTANTAVAAAAATGNGPKMHRVQMDFNPTMDDELKIRAGEIVEIMHEYDDGWCLCKIVRRNKEGASRVDRGVLPRTCLSRLPLKPRNAGQKRPGPPAAGAARSESPAPPPSSATPAPLNTTGAPRSASPALNAAPVKRSMSPGPYGGGPQNREESSAGRPRSNSMNNLTPNQKQALGPSPMNPAAARASNDFHLPIQIPAPATEMAASEVSSVPTTPVTRKPVPKKQQ